MLQLNELLANLREIILPPGHGAGHGSHLHVIRLDTDRVEFTRDRFVNHLKEKYKVSTGYHYPPVWSWEAFSKLGYTGKDCPIAEKTCAQVVSTPIFPRTTSDDVEYIAWAIKQTIADLS